MTTVDRHEAARLIDQMIDRRMREVNIQPMPITSDEQFIRRVYLDIVGRIPSLAEAREFMRSTDPQKRSRLIDRLIASPGHVSHQYNFWADILRVKDVDAGISRTFYVNWLKESLAQNKPYDEWVGELLTSSGCGWQRGNGAVGFYLRDRGMPLDNIANTARIFLGTRLACAQCHDHPYDRWTRRQFYELAAFTHGLTTDNTDKLFAGIYRREKATTDEELRAFSQHIRNTYHRDRVLGPTKGIIPLPDDYQYDDAEPGDRIAARPLFAPGLGDNEVVDSHTDARQRFADWVISPDNPRFTRMIANRLWKRVMGRGLIEPVDDLQDDAKVSHPKLLEYLTRLMIDLRYDMRSYMRILYNTRTYQRCSDPEEPAEGAPYSFRGRVLNRMTAEQLWDSLLTLTVPDVDRRESGFFDTSLYFHGRRVLAGQKDMYSRFDEVKDHDVDQHWEFLARELKAMKEDLRAQGVDLSQNDGKIGGGLSPLPRGPKQRPLVRASELRSPEIPSHFLRIFGQSSREFIEGGNTDANVTQFLSKFNGFVETHLLGDPDSLLMQKLALEESPSTKIDVAFLSILSRAPTDEERSRADQLMDDGDPRWCHDLVWALLNTHEFVFVR